MAGTFRVVETDQGGWECRVWNQCVDKHCTLDQAVEHARSVARSRGQTFELSVEFHDGWVRRIRHPVDSDAAGVGHGASS